MLIELQRTRNAITKISRKSSIHDINSKEFSKIGNSVAVKLSFSGEKVKERE